MAVKEALALEVHGTDNTKKIISDHPKKDNVNVVVHVKRFHYDRCFSYVKIKIEPTASLKDLDSDKLKIEIKRWAKAVVAFARQLTTRSRGDTGSFG